MNHKLTRALGAIVALGALAWTAAASGFVLESSPALGAGANWAAAAGAPNPIAAAGTLNVNPAGTRAFFRLRHP